MCCMEMMTAVNYGIPLNVVVINNGTLSLIRKNQFQLYGERYIDCDFTNPDFGLLAQSFGVNHYRIETGAELDALFAHADLDRHDQPHRNPARQTCLPPLPVGSLAPTNKSRHNAPSSHGSKPRCGTAASMSMCCSRINRHGGGWNP